MCIRDRCADDWNDERKLSRWALSKILKRKCAKVKKKYPEKAEFIESRLNMLSIVESSKVTHIDRAASCLLYTSKKKVQKSCS